MDRSCSGLELLLIGQSAGTWRIVAGKNVRELLGPFLLNCSEPVRFGWPDPRREGGGGGGGGGVRVIFWV